MPTLSAIRWFEILNAGATSEHNSRRGVTHRHGLIKLLHNLPDSVEESFVTKFLNHAPDMIRAFARLSDERLLGQFHHHLFRARRNQRGSTGNQHMPRPDDGIRHFGDT